ILSRYADHARRFEAAAARRSSRSAEIIPFTAPLRELEQEPTPREVQVLQLISEGLVNREIGKVLFLSEETVKSHVRHLLAKLLSRGTNGDKGYSGSRWRLQAMWSGWNGGAHTQTGLRAYVICLGIAAMSLAAFAAESGHGLGSGWAVLLLGATAAISERQRV